MGSLIRWIGKTSRPFSCSRYASLPGRLEELTINLLPETLRDGTEHHGIGGGAFVESAIIQDV